jgi:hypothetical protein
MGDRKLCIGQSSLNPDDLRKAVPLFAYFHLSAQRLAAVRRRNRDASYTRILPL